MTFANRAAFVLLFTAIGFTTLLYGAVHQPVLALFYVILTIVVMLWAVDSFKSETLNVPNSAVPLILLTTAAYGLFQVIPFGTSQVAGVSEVPNTISADPFATMVTSLHFFALAAFSFLTLAFIDGEARVRRTLTLITVFGFGYSFFAILQGFLSPDKIYGIYEPSAGAAPFGSFVNRHNFAAFMEMAIALPLGLLFAGAVPRDKRLLYVTAAGLMGVALLLSGSRGGFVSFVALIIVLVMLTLRSKRGSSKLAVVGLAIALIGAIALGSIFVGGESSLSRIADTAASKDITTDRSHIWSVTLKVIGNNMPFGAGLGAFVVAYSAYDSYSGLARVEQAHNDFLQVAADAGIPGIVLGVLFIVVLFLTARQALDTHDRFRRGVAFGATAGIFAILVHSIFDFVLHTTAISLMFLTLVAILSAVRGLPANPLDAPQRSRRRREPPSAPFKVEGIQ